MWNLHRCIKNESNQTTEEVQINQEHVNLRFIEFLHFGIPGSDQKSFRVSTMVSSMLCFK